VSFAIQYHLHSDALAAEYDDGFCKTSFSQKVRNAFMVYICQITEINLCMVKSTLFRVFRNIKTKSGQKERKK